MPNFNKLNLDAFTTPAWEGSTTRIKTGAPRGDKNIYRLKPDSSVTIRFHDNISGTTFYPDLSAESTEGGAWVKYREAKAEVDVISRKNPDGRVSHLFIPVADYEKVKGGHARRDREDPIHRNLKPSDNDLSRNRSYPTAKDMTLVSVVFIGGSFGNEQYDPEPGASIHIAFNSTQYDAIEMAARQGAIMARNFDQDYSMTDGEWTLRWFRKSPPPAIDWELEVTQDMKVAPLDYLPPMLNGLETLRLIRNITQSELFDVDQAFEQAEAQADEEAVAAFEQAAAADDEDVPVWATAEAKAHLQPKAAKRRQPVQGPRPGVGERHVEEVQGRVRPAYA
jgi:hypothetical protein